MSSTSPEISGPPDPYKPVTAFDGAISTQLVPHPARAFAFEVTFALAHPQLVSLSAQKPPLHFHPYQEEYMRVLEGLLCVEVDGQERLLAPDDGEICVRPWVHHRLYPPPPREGLETTKFVLSGQEVGETFRLDTIFFQNWYGYQDEVVTKREKFDLVQIMCMFDAGASYLSFPRWVPFGRTLSRAIGIVVGRWIGGLLGYQPYHKKWTTDWDLACRKMETSFFQRRFADRTKTA